jgi:aminoglycoside phosphotransferase (APT) family kinase protein
MHSDEITIDTPLVIKLLRAQFPYWANLSSNLSLEALANFGTDNVLYRLGDAMVIRLPRTRETATRIDKEYIWLPKLRPYLPLPIPVPIAKGAPTKDYPVDWAIYSWLEGKPACIERITDPEKAAIQLANFITALHQIDIYGGPAPGLHNFFRGVPLMTRDAETCASIEKLAGIIDTTIAAEIWESVLKVPPWKKAPVWIHGDLLPGNLLVNQGELSAVIDFGGLAVGDPACDLISAWSLFSGKSRESFRRQLAIDNATWLRGRGWALSIGLIGLSYYRTTHPVFAATSARMIDEVIGDYKRMR